MSWLLRSLSMLRSNGPKISRFYFSKMRFPVIKPVPGKLLLCAWSSGKRYSLRDACELGLFPLQVNSLLWYNKHRSHTTNASRCRSDHKMRNRQRSQIQKSSHIREFEFYQKFKIWTHAVYIRNCGMSHRSAFEHSSVTLMYSESASLESIQLFKHQRYFKGQKVWTDNNPQLSSLMRDQASLQSQQNQPLFQFLWNVFCHTFTAPYAQENGASV